MLMAQRLPAPAICTSALCNMMLLGVDDINRNMYRLRRPPMKLIEGKAASAAGSSTASRGENLIRP